MKAWPAADDEPRRVEADADAGGRAGRDDVAGLKAQAGRDRGDEGWHVEDEIARVGILPELAVDPTLHVEVLWVDLVGGHDPRPHGAEAVEGFSEEPLLVVSLPVAGGHIVYDRVAEDVLVGVGLGDVAPPLPTISASSAS